MWSYKPDLDPTTPGIITVASNIVPTNNSGWRAPYSAGANTLTGCDTGVTDLFNGAFACRLTTGAIRIFYAANTATLGKIYEGLATTDVSRAGSYTIGAQFSFCQFGSTTIGANKSDNLQQSTTSGAFADVAGSPPKAKICVADGNQVVLLNYNDGTDTPDGWWCSDVGTFATWTPSASNEARNGRLIDIGGELTAGINCPGGGVIAFKKKGMWVGRYVGQPDVRDWSQFFPDVGCKFPSACIKVADRVFFVDDNDIWMFDGSRPVSITAGCKKTFMAVLGPISAYTAFCWAHDDANGLLYLHYNNVSSFVYNLQTGEWGVADFIDAISGTVFGALNISSADAITKGLTGTSTTANHWLFRSQMSGGPNYTSALANYTAAPIAAIPSSWTLSYQGDYKQASTIKRITPRFFSAPTLTAGGHQVVVTSTKYTPYGTQTSNTGAVNINTQSRFDLQASGHYHKIQHAVTQTTAGNFEWLDDSIDAISAGKD